jgi:hypothetical protein
VTTVIIFHFISTTKKSPDFVKFDTISLSGRRHLCQIPSGAREKSPQIQQPHEKQIVVF